MLLAALNE